MREVYLSEVKLLAEASAVTEAILHGHQGKFLLTFRIGAEEALLIAKAGTPRAFRDLTRAAQLLHDLGIRRAMLDLGQYGRRQGGVLVLAEKAGMSVPARQDQNNSDPEAELSQ